MAATVTDLAARDGVDVVDCDVHVAPRTLEPLLAYMDDYWADYVAHSELFLSPSMNGTYPPAAFLPGVEAGARVAVPATLDELRDGFLAASPASSAVLTGITPFDTSRNPYYEAALCAGVNDWLRGEFLERDDRLRGSLVLPTLDPDAAVAEIERLGAHPGFVQVLLPVRTEAPYGNPRHHRVWEAAERAGLVVGLHAWGRVGNAPTASGFTRSYLEDYASNSQVVVRRMCSRTYSDGRRLTHGTSRQTAFQSLSKRQSRNGSHAKPHSSSTTRRAPKRSNTPSETRLVTWAWTTTCELLA